MIDKGFNQKVNLLSSFQKRTFAQNRLKKKKKILIQKADAAEAAIGGAALACKGGKLGCGKNRGSSRGLALGDPTRLHRTHLNAIKKPLHQLLFLLAISRQSEAPGLLEGLRLVGRTTLSVPFRMKGIV